MLFGIRDYLSSCSLVRSAAAVVRNAGYSSDGRPIALAMEEPMYFFNEFVFPVLRGFLAPFHQSRCEHVILRTTDVGRKGNRATLVLRLCEEVSFMWAGC